MIVNMHIRKDFQKWMLPKHAKGRVVAMCGVKTPVKFAGIPGVSWQEAFIDGKYSGWCVHCCGLALEKMNETLTEKKTSDLMEQVYVYAMEMCTKQIVMSQVGR